MSFVDLIQPLDRINLLIAQWRENEFMQPLVDSLLEVADREFIFPLLEIERAADINLAAGYFLDLLGNRIGVFRYFIDTNEGKLGFDIATGAEFDGRLGFQGRMHSDNPFLSGQTRIGDDYFRRVLKSRYFALRSSGTNEDICNALDLLFAQDGTSVCLTREFNSIELQAFSADDLFYGLIENDVPSLIGVPPGIAFQLIRRPEIDLREPSLPGGEHRWEHIYYASNVGDLNISARDRVPDLDVNGLAGTNPQGMYVNDDILYISDFAAQTGYAYQLGVPNHGTRLADKDINFTAGSIPDVIQPTGIWGDGSTMWMADARDVYMYAFEIGDNRDYGDRKSGHEFTLVSENSSPRGVWGDGTTMWVADSGQNKLFAYGVVDRNVNNRPTGSDITLDAENTSARGITSDGEIMYVADDTDKKIYAYNISDGSRAAAFDYDTLDAAGNDRPTAIWFDGATMFVADNPASDDKVYAYGSTIHSVAIGSSAFYHILNDEKVIVRRLDPRTGEAVPAYSGGTIYIRHVLYSSRNDLSQIDGFATADNVIASLRDATFDEVLDADGNLSLITEARQAFLEFNDVDVGNQIDEFLFYDKSTETLRVVNAANVDADVLDYEGQNTAEGYTWTDVHDPAPNRKVYQYETRQPENGRDVTIAARYNVPDDDNSPFVAFTIGQTATITGSHLIGNELFIATDTTNVSLYNTETNAEDTSYLPTALSNNVRYVWADENNVWCAYSDINQIDAFPRDPVSSTAVASRNITLTAHENIKGIWSNGNTLWIACQQASDSAWVVIAFDISDATSVRDESKDLALSLTATQAVEDMMSDDVYLYMLLSDSTSTAGLRSVRIYNLPNDFIRDRSIPNYDNLLTTANHPVLGHNGLWRDGEILYTLSIPTRSVIAYEMYTGARRSDLDINLARENIGATSLYGFTRGGEKYLYVTDNNPATATGGQWKLLAYKLSDGSRATTFDINITRAHFGDPRANTNLYGVFATDSTVWAAMEVIGGDSKLVAYRLNNRARRSGQDVNLGSFRPSNMWSDGTTLWLQNHGFIGNAVVPQEARAYTLPSGSTITTLTRDNDKDVTLPASLTHGIAGDGTRMYLMISDIGVNYRINAYLLGNRSKYSGPQGFTFPSPNGDLTEAPVYAITGDATNIWTASDIIWASVYFNSSDYQFYYRDDGDTRWSTAASGTSPFGTDTRTASLDFEDNHEFGFDLPLDLATAWDDLAFFAEDPATIPAGSATLFFITHEENAYKLIRIDLAENSISGDPVVFDIPDGVLSGTGPKAIAASTSFIYIIDETGAVSVFSPITGMHLDDLSFSVADDFDTLDIKPALAVRGDNLFMINGEIVYIYTVQGNLIDSFAINEDIITAGIHGMDIQQSGLYTFDSIAGKFYIDALWTTVGLITAPERDFDGYSGLVEENAPVIPGFDRNNKELAEMRMVRFPGNASVRFLQARARSEAFTQLESSYHNVNFKLVDGEHVSEVLRSPIYIVNRDATASHIYVYDINDAQIPEVFPLDSANADPVGVSGNRDSVYVVDQNGTAPKVFTYTSDIVHQPTLDFSLDITSTPPNSAPQAMSGDDAHLYILDTGVNHIFSYNLDGTKDNEFPLVADNTGATGLAVVGENIYVVDSIHDRVFVYTVRGDHVVQQDFELIAENNSPIGIAVDGAVVYILNEGTLPRVYAYNNAVRGDRLPLFDFDLRGGNTSPKNIGTNAVLLTDSVAPIDVSYPLFVRPNESVTHINFTSAQELVYDINASASLSSFFTVDSPAYLSNSEYLITIEQDINGSFEPITDNRLNALAADGTTLMQENEDGEMVPVPSPIFHLAAVRSFPDGNDGVGTDDDIVLPTLPTDSAPVLADGLTEYDAVIHLSENNGFAPGETYRYRIVASLSTDPSAVARGVFTIRIN